MPLSGGDSGSICGSVGSPCAEEAWPEPSPPIGDRVLLVNPSIFDTRLHWAKWQQPTLLLRLASYLKRSGADVKLLDAVHHEGAKRLRRQGAAILDLDGVTVYRWRLGASKFEISTWLRRLGKDGWCPSTVYVECFTTFWWQGAAEAIDLVKDRFPEAQVILVGAYAALAPQHAKQNTRADVILGHLPASLSPEPGDLSLYERPPNFAYVTLGDGRRSVDQIIEEIAAKVKTHRTRQFAFADQAIASRHGDLFREVLLGLASRGLRINLYALGNVSPSDLVEQSDLAQLMKRAGFVQISFADDRDSVLDADAAERLIEDYRRAAELCHRAGFAPRTDELNGAVSVGRPGEDLSERAKLATALAHYIGAVIPWPYQPSSDELPDVPLEDQNGKLFPLRQSNDLRFRDYMEFIGLCAVLNAKYRDRTFDFCGDGLIPRLFRDSVARRGWDPDPEVKGSLRLPMVMPR